MGIFTSACKNCGIRINWFVMIGKEGKRCIHCHTDNKLMGNMLGPNDVNIIMREAKDRQLYDSIVKDYVNGSTGNTNT